MCNLTTGEIIPKLYTSTWEIPCVFGSVYKHKHHFHTSPVLILIILAIWNVTCTGIKSGVHKCLHEWVVHGEKF